MKKNKLSLLISTVLLTQSYSAFADQPEASELINRIYGGVHAAYINSDNDHLASDGGDYDDGYGGGVEVGVRINNPLELRLSYTAMNAELQSGDDLWINKIGVDMLYFPTYQNFYFLGGINQVDYADGEAAANLGAGYRHYFSDSLALYGELKANYQFEDEYTDGIVRTGVVYFFGGSSEEPEPVVAKEVVAVAPLSEVPKDMDSDGVIDSEDQCPATPANDKVDATGCTIVPEPEPAPVPEVQVEEKLPELAVEFDTNKASVKAEYLPRVEELAVFLNENPEATVKINGHTDSVGAASYNKKLSQKRADSIATLLVDKYGVNASQVTAVGYGEEQLLDTSSTAEANERNRRIEIELK